MSIQTGAVSPLVPMESPAAMRLVVDAIRARSLCCDCLASTTGLTAPVVRWALLTASRAFRLDTWTPCQSCGAVDETYRITAEGSRVADEIARTA
jgi:hypothetical protein